MRKNQIFYSFFTLGLISILGCSYIWNLSLNLTCQQSDFILTTDEIYYINPEKVILQPWFGQHHAFGIFMMSKQYTADHSITIALPGNQILCGHLEYADTDNVAGVSAKPGYFLIKGFLQTRIAIGLILQGKGNQLQQLSNWKLGYFKQPPK